MSRDCKHCMGTTDAEWADDIPGFYGWCPWCCPEQASAQAADDYATIERLRAALVKISEWDCLNAEPDTRICADFPWLKGHVMKALGEDG